MEVTNDLLACGILGLSNLLIMYNVEDAPWLKLMLGISGFLNLFVMTVPIWAKLLGG